jgi:hypothetical protein
MAQQEQYHPRYPLLEKYYVDNHRGRKLEERLEVGLEALVNLLMDGLKLDFHVLIICCERDIFSGFEAFTTPHSHSSTMG